MQNLLKKASIKQKYIMFCIMLLAAISIIEFFVAFASSAYNVSSPLGTYNSSVYSFLKSGSGTSEQDPYIIANEDEFYQFCNCVNEGNDFKGRFIKLATDLDFGCDRLLTVYYYNSEVNYIYEGYGGGVVIGNTKEHAFKGNFDGCGHYIYNYSLNNTWFHTTDIELKTDEPWNTYSIYDGPYDKDNPYEHNSSGKDIIEGPYAGGLFGYIDGATIKNVYLASTPIEIQYEDSKTQAELEKELKYENMTIEDLIQNALRLDIFGVSGTCAGGLVGKATGSISIENCKNIGVNVFGARFKIDEYDWDDNRTHFINNGELVDQWEGDVYSCAGGIVGDAGEASGTITGCLNYAKVKGDCAGGIVGRASDELKISECLNCHGMDTYKYENSNKTYSCEYNYLTEFEDENISFDYKLTTFHDFDIGNYCKSYYQYGFVADINGVNIGGICGYGGKSFEDCGNTGTVKKYNNEGIISDHISLGLDENGEGITYQLGDGATGRSFCTYDYVKLTVCSMGSGGIVGSSSAKLTSCYSTKIADTGSAYSLCVTYRVSAKIYDNILNYEEFTKSSKSSSLTIETGGTGLGGGSFKDCYTENIISTSIWVDGEEPSAEIKVGEYAKATVSFTYDLTCSNDGHVKINYGFKHVVNGSIREATDNYDMTFSAGTTKKGLTDNANIKYINLGSKWVRSASINDGYPHLKRFYWEDNAGLDGADFGS